MIRILDASVVVKWFALEDPVEDQNALTVLDQVKTNVRNFAVPELLYSECLHVFWHKFQNAADVSWAMERLFRLGIKPLRFDASIASLAAESLEDGLSGYDATYLAFARSVKGKWFTFNKVALKNNRFVSHVEWLGS